MFRIPLCLKFLLFFCLSFPLAAQELLECPGGLTRRYSLKQGGTVLLQPLPESPAVAISLVQPWGIRHQPAARPGLADLLARVVSRTSTSHPHGSLLVELNRMGGRSDYQVGQVATSWTLVVPRRSAAWAWKVQVERLRSAALKGEDLGRLSALWGPGLSGLELDLFAAQHWNPEQAVIAVVGSFEPPAAELASYRQLPPLPPVEGLPTGVGELHWHFAWPSDRVSQAQAYLWKQRLQGQAVKLSLDPAAPDLVLSTPCRDASEQGQARQRLQSALSAEPLPGEALAAQRQWLSDWEELGARSRLLALWQRQGEAGAALGMYEAILASRPVERPFWSGQLPLEAPYQEARSRSQLPSEETASSGRKPGRLAVPPASLPEVFSAPPFVRWEYAPSAGALIQSLPWLPAVALRATIPGGAAYDPPSETGRAQSLGRWWQSQFPTEWATRVETHPTHWTFSCYLPRDRVSAWIEKFFAVQSQVPEAVLASPQVSRPALHEAYQLWLGLLFPEEHPLLQVGSEAKALSLSRLQDLAREVRQRSRWQLTLSGDVTAPEVELAVSQVAPPRPDLSLSVPGESLPTRTALPLSARPLPCAAPGAPSALLIGGYGPSRRELDYYAFVLLLDRLAGDPLESRLAVELRHKKALVSRLEVSFLSSQTTAPWLLRMDCKKEDAEQVLVLLETELESLRKKPLAAEELRQAVIRLEGLQQVANASAWGRVDQLRNLEWFRLSDSYAQGFAGIYRQLKPADLQACARVRLAPERLVRVHSFPAER